MYTTITHHLEQNGYSLAIDYPYKGTIVPQEYYQTNNNILSIMVEVNRRLYMNGGVVDDGKVKELNQLVSNIFSIQRPN